MKTCGIYEIINTVTGKRYIGQSVDVYTRKRMHFCDLKKGGHFNSYLQRSFNKYGCGCFEFRVLEEVPEDILDVKEQTWICFYKSNQNNFGYNSESGGSLNKRHSKATRQKISLSHKGMIFSDEHRRNIGLVRKGVPLSEEIKNKISKSLTGRVASEETRRKLSALRLGKPRSPETIAKMSVARKGVPVPYEMRRRISETLKGRKLSKETCAKMSIARKGHLVSKETRNKTSKSNKGRVITIEWRKKLSEANKGKKQPYETRKKISETLKRRNKYK